MMEYLVTAWRKGGQEEGTEDNQVRDEVGWI